MKNLPSLPLNSSIAEIKISRPSSTHQEEFSRLLQPTNSEASFIDNSLTLKNILNLLGPIGSIITTSALHANTEFKEKRLYSFLKLTASRIDMLYTPEQLHKIIFSNKEYFYDLFSLMTEEAMNSRTEEKRERFTNIFLNQLQNPTNLDDAIEFTKVTAAIEDLDFLVFARALNTSPCEDTNFENQKVVTLSQNAQLERGPTFLKLLMPNIPEYRLERSCSILIRERLFHDTGLGSMDARGMEYFSITKWGEEYANWVASPVK